MGRPCLSPLAASGATASLRHPNKAHCLEEGDLSPGIFEQEKLIVSSKAAIKPSTLTANGIDNSSDVLETEELSQVTGAPTSSDTAAETPMRSSSFPTRRLCRSISFQQYNKRTTRPSPRAP